MREINPFDASAKLGAETLLEIMKVTGRCPAPAIHGQRDGILP